MKIESSDSSVCIEQNDSGKATTQDRTLSNVADVLAFMASGRGGLRTGPAANRAFASAIELLKDEDSRRLGIQAMRRELTNWLQTPEKLIRAGMIVCDFPFDH
ncbi:unnamed protein product [Anisakis simplex]|uniref:Transcriptional regulator n=1 Tax=Anisakis simplex TaxID=6269 RepID=A0A0M3JCX2_ANISI|nr:unnamed protein product [Anisakis simplex]